MKGDFLFIHQQGKDCRILSGLAVDCALHGNVGGVLCIFVCFREIKVQRALVHCLYKD